jgi:hypothetical protein
MKTLMLSALFSAACAAAGIAGCSANPPCDADEVFLPVGICLQTSLLDTADAGDSGIPFDAPTCALFGDPCADTDDCGCGTNVCALRTEDAEGICTHTGCLENPGLCPADWECVDLSPYGPNLPSLCLPPS